MMDRFSAPDLWGARSRQKSVPPVWREKPSVVNPHESRVGSHGLRGDRRDDCQEDTITIIDMANHQGYLSPYMTNSLAIRQEIQRFESVHPSIYAIYDLIELVPDPLLAQQIREHVVCIEGRTQIEMLHMRSKNRIRRTLLIVLRGQFIGRIFAAPRAWNIDIIIEPFL